MQCKKCGERFSVSVWIDGKKRNLQHRKFCLSCSPFGRHNTKDLCGTPSSKDRPNVQKICKVCQRPFGTLKKIKGLKCWSCASAMSRKRHSDRLYSITGGACWICNYSECRAALDFHHMDPTKKEFQLSVREMQYKWDRILNEVQKCVLLCCRCHREYHYGLINHSRLKEIYEMKWQEIRSCPEWPHQC